MVRKIIFIPLVILAGIFGPFFGVNHEERTKDISPRIGDHITPTLLVAHAKAHTALPSKQKLLPRTTVAHDCSGNLELIESGTASWYGDAFQGKPMKNGKPFNKLASTVAYHALPLNTPICIEQNGVMVPAVVTDTGAFRSKYGRTIDVSEGIAIKLSFKERGLAYVNIYRVNTDT